MMQTGTETRGERIRKGVFRYLSFKLFLISSLFIGALFTFAIIVHEAVYENEQAFDNRVFAFFATYNNDALISVMKFFTFFGSDKFMIPAYIVLTAYFLLRKKYRYSLHIAIVVITSTALVFGLKEFTKRSRPDLPIIQGITNYSFPSGHALSTFILCGIFTYIIWHGLLPLFQKWLLSILLFCFTMTVGISRIILKVHYPTDVIAGFCLGTVWAITSLWLLRKISRKNGLKTKENEEPEAINAGTQ